MRLMFSECNKLKEIKGINKFNTKEITNMNSMFNLCKELEYLDLSNFNTSKVNDMGWMFAGCNKLKYLNLLNFILKDECLTTNIFENINHNECRFYANDSNLKNLFLSNNCTII